MANLGAFDFSSYRIENDRLRGVRAAEPHPVGHMDFARLAFGGDAKVAQFEKPGAENYAPYFGDDEFAGCFLVECSRYTVSGFNGDQFPFKGKVVEAVEIE